VTTATAAVSADHGAAIQRFRRLAPTLVAAVFAAAYVILSPTSLDLADHLFRAQLFRDEGFGLWNNLWYSGHHIVGAPNKTAPSQAPAPKWRRTSGSNSAAVPVAASAPASWGESSAETAGNSTL
jgi:hypothetical protein